MSVWVRDQSSHHTLTVKNVCQLDSARDHRHSTRCDDGIATRERAEEEGQRSELGAGAVAAHARVSIVGTCDPTLQIGPATLADTHAPRARAPAWGRSTSARPPPAPARETRTPSTRSCPWPCPDVSGCGTAMFSSFKNPQWQFRCEGGSWLCSRRRRAH